MHLTLALNIEALLYCQQKPLVQSLTLSLSADLDAKQQYQSHTFSGLLLAWTSPIAFAMHDPYQLDKDSQEFRRTSCVPSLAAS
eukprot:1567377-Amphidinium_carterae.3